MRDQSGGFSPSKLRAVLLGIERKQKKEEELESGLALRSEANEIEARGEIFFGSIFNSVKSLKILKSTGKKKPN